MTAPLQGREGELTVWRRHVVLRQDDSEEDEESLAVSGRQDGGGAHQRAATEGPAGQFVGQRHLPTQSVLLSEV